MRSSSGREFSAAVLNGILPQNSHRGSIPAMAVNLLKQSLRVGREVDDVPGCSVEGGVPSESGENSEPNDKQRRRTQPPRDNCMRPLLGASGCGLYGFVCLSSANQKRLARSWLCRARTVNFWQRDEWSSLVGACWTISTNMVSRGRTRRTSAGTGLHPRFLGETQIWDRTGILYNKKGQGI